MALAMAHLKLPCTVGRIAWPPRQQLIREAQRRGAQDDVVELSAGLRRPDEKESEEVEGPYDANDSTDGTVGIRRPVLPAEIEESFDEGAVEAEDELLINSLSMLCPFEAEEKQALLEAPSLETRRETLITLIEFALRGGDTEEILQ